jgi:pimeloyl-ACP methyl ester carboxylesterase
MINHSFINLVFIRICIFFLHYLPVISLCLVILLVWQLIAASLGSSLLIPIHLGIPLLCVLVLYLILEAIYFVALYRPHLLRLQTIRAQHPALWPPARRVALFDQCVRNIRDPEAYLRLWFLGADPDKGEIRRENVREFFLWAFFDQDSIGSVDGGQDEVAVQAELETYLTRCEQLLGRRLAPGKGSARPLRLTLDNVDTRFRTFLWYVTVATVDALTCVALSRAGFTYLRQPIPEDPAFKMWRKRVFPPRLALPLLTPATTTNPAISGQSAEGEGAGLTYWFRPPKSGSAGGGLPIVFLHGVGIGFWPYVDFLRDMARKYPDVSIIAVEILAVSMRLTDPPPKRPMFLHALKKVLARHGVRDFVLVAHSYGTFLTTHILRNPQLGPRVSGLVLVDPVTLLLHLPNVAYNFTRRRPRTANQWQLWYFASTDLGIAEGLGRHFFWRENAVWKEELTVREVEDHDGYDDEVEVTELEYAEDESTPLIRGDTPIDDYLQGLESAGGMRNVAVSLSGRDLIVDTRSVAQYLSSQNDFGSMSDDEIQQANSFVDGTRSGDRENERYRKCQGVSGIEMLWFPNLDHAQVFDAREDREQLLEVIGRFSVGIC